MAKLEIRSGKSQGEVVDLPENQVLEVGTKRQATVRLRDQGVSYVHAALTLKGHVLLVEDRKSREGTFVGGKRLGDEPAEVAPGEVFKVADVEMAFLIPAPAGVAAVEAQPAPEVSTPLHSSAADSAALAAATAAVASLEARLAESEKARQTVSFEKQRLAEDLEQVRSQLQEAEDIASDGVEHVNAVEERCQNLENEVNALRAELESREQSLRAQYSARQLELEGDVESLKAERSQLKKDLAAALNSSSQLEERLDQAERRGAAAQQSLEQLRVENQSRISALESELAEARRAARAAKMRSRELAGEKLDIITGSDDESALRDALLASFGSLDSAVAPGTTSPGESLAELREMVARAARQVEEARAGTALTGAAESSGLEDQLRRRDEELQRLKDEFEAKCAEMEDLNSEYQQVVDELEAIKKS